MKYLATLLIFVLGGVIHAQSGGRTDDNQVFNRIDTVSNGVYVVLYDYRDQIDTVTYDSVSSLGVISSYTKNGTLIRRQKYRDDNLPSPEIEFGESLKQPGEIVENNSYYGRSIKFSYPYLSSQEEFYETGALMSIKHCDFYMELYIL